MSGASEPSDRAPAYSGDEQVPKLKSLITNLSGGRNVKWLVHLPGDDRVGGTNCGWRRW